MPTDNPNPKIRHRAPTGHEPAKGFPDPRAVVIQASQATHKPNPNGGTICGLKAGAIPMNAAAYSDEDPTCPTCADWLRKTRAHTYGIYGKPDAHGSSAQPPPAPEPTTSEKPET
jgi:hypothetical protein